MSIARILEQIIAERTAQQAQGYDAEHDATHSREKWISLLARHVGLAVNNGGEVDPGRFERQMLRTAALCVAAIEAVRRRAEQPEKAAGANPVGKGW